MITLVTGRPGAGKTLWTVAKIAELNKTTDRLIFTDIDGLTLEGVQPLPGDDRIQAARDWHKLPERAIIVLDECQRAFPPVQPLAQVATYISAFETHRHRGHDVYLITQHPKLIDGRVRRLVGEHVHLYRPLGFARSRVYRWQGINEDPDPVQSVETAEASEFVFPKHLFSAYRSAVEHFVKPRIPPKLIVMAGLAVVSVLAGLYYGLGGLLAPASPLEASSVTASTAELGADCIARIGSRFWPQGCETR